MKKLLNIFLSLVLATTFLLSYTGLRLLIHHCGTCSTTEMALFNSASGCCHDSAIGETCDITLASTCCVTGGYDHEACSDCCEEEVVYLKKDFEFSKERQQLRVESTPVDMPADNSQELLVEGNSDKSILAVNIDPPSRLYGKSFILFTHQLKIC